MHVNEISHSHAFFLFSTPRALLPACVNYKLSYENSARGC